MMSLVNVRVANLRRLGYRSLKHVDGTYDSPWRNTFHASRYGRRGCIDRYREHVEAEISAGRLNIEDLRGKVLGCWCTPQACHGDVLIELLHAMNELAARLISSIAL